MNTETVMKSLELMGKGMAAIFVVILVIYLIVMLMIKYTGRKAQ